jgi:hypothetical protein
MPERRASGPHHSRLAREDGALRAREMVVVEPLKRERLNLELVPINHLSPSTSGSGEIPCGNLPVADFVNSMSRALG